MGEQDFPPSWFILTDFNQAIRVSWDEVRSARDGRPLSMEFAVYSASFGGPIDEPGEWWLDVSSSSDSFMLTEWEQAFVELDGNLKWDGCINWKTNPACMMHGCGPLHAKIIAAIFDTIYHVGKRHMDLLDDPAPDMPSNVVEMAG